MSIQNNVTSLLEGLEKGNCYGEKITLVAATKTRTAEEINEALQVGITDIGENKVQEFKDKFDLVRGGNRHFIGHLQTNKVKYLIGKTYLYHSVDRNELAEEIAKRSQRAGIVSDILIQINIGCEESKGGYPLEEGKNVYKQLSQTEGLRVRGFMAMLPLSSDGELLVSLCKQMRALYDDVKERDENICYLSMGMSGDWKLCIENGANMVRIGSSIFGEREYR